jgi:hypothetical protein
MFPCRVSTALSCKKLTAGGSQRPVIFITGKGDIPTSVRAMKAGAIDFTKPVSNQDLLGNGGPKGWIQIPAISRRLGMIEAKIAT